MPIVKCSECGNKINIKSLECPECGTKITLDDELKKDYSIFKIKRLVSHPVSIIITIILFIILIGIISSKIVSVTIGITSGIKPENNPTAITVL